MQKRILISNDDGYTSSGLHALIDSVKDLGEIIAFAPDGPRSGMSSAITSIHPVRYTLASHADNVYIYKCSGTPVDCVKLAINEMADNPPDIVLSGINHGSNAGICVLYSGTMGAAIEGCICKIPSAGFSLADYKENADFSEAKKIARYVAEKLLNEGLPPDVCLNVNVPKGNVNGIRMTSQTRGKWINEFFKSKDANDKDIFWLSGNFQNWEPNNELCDEYALANQYASIVPVSIDMTKHEVIKTLKSWEF